MSSKCGPMTDCSHCWSVSASTTSSDMSIALFPQSTLVDLCKTGTLNYNRYGLSVHECDIIVF